MNFVTYLVLSAVPLTIRRRYMFILFQIVSYDTGRRALLELYLLSVLEEEALQP